MKKTLMFFAGFFMMILTAVSVAQPQYYNLNTGTGINTFPFGQAVGKQVQWLILAGDFNQPTGARSGRITKIYFWMGSNATTTFTNLTIKLGQAAITTLPTGVVYTGTLDTVYYRASIQLTSVNSAWMSITLDRPYLYDSAQALIIDVQQCQASSSAMYVRQTTGSNFRRNYLTTATCPQVYSGQDGQIINCGIDVAPTTPQYYNYNTPGGDNSFPMNQAAGKQCQWLVGPGEYNQPTPPLPGGLITGFYFRISGTYPLTPTTYTNFHIAFGQTALTTLPTGSFYTGQMDTVYFRASVTFQAALNTWLFIPLDNPYSYNPTLSLILQVGQCGAVGATSGAFVLTHTNITNYRRCWSVAGCPFVYAGQGLNVVNNGINISYPVGINNNNNQIPDAYKLEQNYPNPFNPITSISFSIPKSGTVKLAVYDMLGREVAVLSNGFKMAGNYSLDFDASNLSSGAYFYKIESGDFVETKKMMLVK